MKRTTPPRSLTTTTTPALVPLRAPSGHLVGYFDARRCVLQVKPRSGRPVEEIDLRPLIDRESLS